MSDYEVQWRFDVEDAAGPVEASRRALAVQRDPDSWATVFQVREKGTTAWTTVDPQPFSDDGRCRHLHAPSGAYCSKPEGHTGYGDRKHGHAGVFW